MSPPCHAESVLWHFYPPRSRMNISSLCLHHTDRGYTLRFREEVQVATTELKAKEPRIKGKHLSGEKAEGIHRKFLLGWSDAPLPSSALSNHSALCTLALLFSPAISFRLWNEPGEAGGVKEQQSDCSVNLDSATNSLLTSCFLFFSSLSSLLLGYCLGSRCLFRHLWFTSLGLALQGPAQPCLDTLCLIQISTVPVHHPCTPNLHREFGRSSSPSPHPSQIVLQSFGLHLCRM